MQITFRRLAFTTFLAVLTSTPAWAGAELDTPHRGVQILGVALGTHVDSKRRVPVPYTTFRPAEPKIVASVHTTAAQPPVEAISLGALWTFDSPDGPQTVIDASAELEFEGEGYTVFEISNKQPWPTGNYRLTIYLDGDAVHTTLFTVK